MDNYLDVHDTGVIRSMLTRLSRRKTDELEDAEVDAFNSALGRFHNQVIYAHVIKSILQLNRKDFKLFLMKLIANSLGDSSSEEEDEGALNAPQILPAQPPPAVVQPVVVAPPAQP